MPLPCRCHAIAMLLPRHFHVVAMLLPCDCHTIAMLLPCSCRALAVARSAQQHAARQQRKAVRDYCRIAGIVAHQPWRDFFLRQKSFACMRRSFVLLGRRGAHDSGAPPAGAPWAPPERWGFPWSAGASDGISRVVAAQWALSLCALRADDARTGASVVGIRADAGAGCLLADDAWAGAPVGTRASSCRIAGAPLDDADDAWRGRVFIQCVPVDDADDAGRLCCR